MLTYYCPFCYTATRQHHGPCPNCGRDLAAVEEGDRVERLVRFSLHHPEPSTAARAARILGRLADQRALVPLCDLAGTTQDPEVAVAVAEALGEFASDRAVSALAELLEHGTVMVRSRVVEALARIGTPAARDLLRSIAQSDPSTGVREEALFALGQD
jgi:HEAT repeat protein